jgi:hypothetical protein
VHNFPQYQQYHAHLPLTAWCVALAPRWPPRQTACPSPGAPTRSAGRHSRAQQAQRGQQAWHSIQVWTAQGAADCWHSMYSVYSSSSRGAGAAGDHAWLRWCRATAMAERSTLRRQMGKKAMQQRRQVAACLLLQLLDPLGQAPDLRLALLQQPGAGRARHQRQAGSGGGTFIEAPKGQCPGQGSTGGRAGRASLAGVVDWAWALAGPAGPAGQDQPCFCKRYCLNAAQCPTSMYRGRSPALTTSTFCCQSCCSWRFTSSAAAGRRKGRGGQDRVSPGRRMLCDTGRYRQTHAVSQNSVDSEHDFAQRVRQLAALAQGALLQG